MVHVTLLVVHIVTGTIGLLLGPLAMRQDTRRFASAQRGTGVLSAWYRPVVLLVCLSATGLVVERRGDLWWLVPVSALTYGLAVLAKLSARQRWRGWTHGYVHGQGGSYLALVTALIVVALVVDGPVAGPAELVPWLAPTAIGVVLIEVWRRRLSGTLPAGADREGAST
ncbi:hypothetical protein [Amycolatopsis sp. CA-230715]|uniref:hypothetical protein n=1 Tax=Amycolatopsis sp. CA-230715 TaxID=2745196 RepID=UPI001C011B9C|nr:hypothetical protein [Amycolatopsis sp. CA-230715]QWF84087.1 hypothetical protein HUW46_07531 [Amycolatopsis sp. CA-230715]